MDGVVGRIRWRRRTQWTKPLFLLALALALPLFLFALFLSSPSSSSSAQLPTAAPPQCGGGVGALVGERFLWYGPHSGFSNQVGELRNAAVLAAILNRTLIVPPVLDHHAVALGSCPKFRVSSPTQLRAAVWDHVMELVRSRRYVSIADIVDLSSITPSIVKTIDLRVFASLWCGLDMQRACFSGLCCKVSQVKSLSGNTDQCRSLLSGLEDGAGDCVYAVEDDCRTTIWTFQQHNEEILDSFQPDKELLKKKKISFVRKRRDVYKTFGPGSKAEKAVVLAFGTVFSAPYKGSELYIDIHESPEDLRIELLLKKIEFLPFAPEIMAAGKDFAVNNIKEPFLCAQLRLLDGQFKNHWKATFSALKEKLNLLELETKGPIHVFIMTDLPASNWTQTYLGEVRANERYILYTLQENDELVLQAAERLMAAEHGVRLGFLPKVADGESPAKYCGRAQIADILLYIEESVCSCGLLGFVGTAGSTIAESIEMMRRNNVCKI